MKISNIISWLLRIIAAAILLQTLYFKLTGHPESVVLFTKLGVVGIESNGDKGELFMLAIVVMFCCLILLVMHRKEGINLIRKISKK